ncbi:class I adenylate-forming enzyme family protein [Erythrobacter alti]|uniref:class I adenylate-forming enzyme family protein n=1 Tax=Erythrobacter alti TaxID=1896145 RepID=UPI0030F4005F
MGERPLSLLKAPPLEDEDGLGALTLGGWLQELCQQFADREALVFHEDGARTSWTYAELWERANEVARSLHALGIGKGERVGVLMTNRPEFISTVFGTALAGGVACTFSTFSTEAELEYLLELSGCTFMLLERRVLKKDFSGVLTGIEPLLANCQPGQIESAKLPFLRHVVAVGGGDAKAIEEWDAFLRHGDNVAQTLVDARAATVTPADPGALFFSSGTTAKPKGIINSHRGMALQLWRYRKFVRTEADCRAWSANGFFWSGSFVQGLGSAMTPGGALVLQKTFDPGEALELMDREQATMAIAWPHQWPQLVAAPNWADVDLSALKYVDPKFPIGEHPTATFSWQEPSATYGATETFTVSTTFPSGTPEDEIAGSSGKPQPGGFVKIIDPLSGETVPLGERGEIAVKGPTLMLGYVGIPLSDTLDDEGYFRSGDGGYVDAEGRLFWEGRLNDIIKTGGANVSPLEIDETIRKCPGVKLCQTVGIPHDTLGELVVTAVVTHSGETLTEESVRAFTKQTLASYKVPRRVLFFTEDELELTGSNKLKTSDIKERAIKRLELEPA